MTAAAQLELPVRWLPFCWLPFCWLPCCWLPFGLLAALQSAGCPSVCCPVEECLCSLVGPGLQLDLQIAHIVLLAGKGA